MVHIDLDQYIKDKNTNSNTAQLEKGNDMQQTTFSQDLFELCPEDLHQLYMKMHDEVPGAMD